MVLQLLSTATMVKLGRTQGNLQCGDPGRLVVGSGVLEGGREARGRSLGVAARELRLRQSQDCRRFAGRRGRCVGPAGRHTVGAARAGGEQENQQEQRVGGARGDGMPASGPGWVARASEL